MWTKLHLYRKYKDNIYMPSSVLKMFVINLKNKYIILHSIKILNKPFCNKLSVYNNIIMVCEITVRQHAHSP